MNNSKRKTILMSKSTTGFTLVEALVAISLLMVAISSPMYIAQKGLSASMFARDQMTASFLAQDGIEAVKNIRDYMAINQKADGTPYTAGWLELLNSCICNDSDKICNFDDINPYYCNIDTTKTFEDNGNIEGSIKVKGSSENPLKIFRSTVGEDSLFVKFDLQAIQDSKFSRMINIKKSSDNLNEAVVQVRVSWNQGTEQQKVDLKTFIYNYAINPF
jgi:type II secretory pathway pseudopilin PulG